tara:strand:+ start:54 stop:293 length:240 start_codon:yes stop_codon:yes gene_type:complete
MKIDQIVNWLMGLDIIILTTIGFFLGIGFLFLVTAVYSLIYDKAFRKKYLLKLSTIFFIFIGGVIGVLYLFVKHGALIL